MEISLIQFFGFFFLAFLTFYSCNKTFTYYAKFCIYYCVSILYSALVMPYFIYNAKSVMNILFFAESMKHLTKLLGIKWTLRGSEHITPHKSLIIVANHQSSIDVLGMFNVWRMFKYMTVIAKKQILYVPFFGQAAYLADLIFIDRQSSKAKDSMNKAMKRLKEKKIKLWIFPEGTRRNTGEIHTFKKGAFHTAIQEEIPIVPVIFSSYKHFLDTKNKTFDDGEIIITALPEISTKGMTLDDVDKLIERVRNEMIKVYDATSKESSSNVQY